MKKKILLSLFNLFTMIILTLSLFYLFRQEAIIPASVLFLTLVLKKNSLLKFKIINSIPWLFLMGYGFVNFYENVYVLEISIFIFFISFFKDYVQSIIYNIIFIILWLKPAIFLYVLPFFPYLIHEYL
jgi:hypothetical protein